jgi:hypothetical protein
MNMRAFMSDRWPSPFFVGSDAATACAIKAGRVTPEMAEREARAILAETEPDGPQTASFGIERVAARNCAPNVWTGALAEALAAWIGEGE